MDDDGGWRCNLAHMDKIHKILWRACMMKNAEIKRLMGH